MKRKSNVCQFNMVKELPALGYLYNVCHDVTCAGMPVMKYEQNKIHRAKHPREQFLLCLRG